MISNPGPWCAIAVSYTHLDVYKRQVTWISEDMAGSVRIALEYPCDRASDNETPAQILEGSSSYRISGDAYHALGDKPGFDQEKGDAPGLPDGKAITVIAEQTATGETLVATGESHTVLYTETVESTEKGGKKDSCLLYTSRRAQDCRRRQDRLVLLRIRRHGPHGASCRSRVYRWPRCQ